MWKRAGGGNQSIGEFKRNNRGNNYLVQTRMPVGYLFQLRN